ncbi:hypothetical protein ACFLWN_03435 [Chloroflexota bacterium]
MVKRPRNLYLYLTLACFLGIIAIFILDGYMGLYDTLRINAGEFEQEISPVFWIQQDRFEGSWSTSVNWGGTASFRYQIDNRRFSVYQETLDVSVWRNQEKVQDITSQQISINPFQSTQLEWAINTADIAPPEAPTEHRLNYTVLIQRGDIERKLVLNVNYPYVPPPPTVVPK